MILFFYGEDSYRSLEKVKAIREKYIDASLGDTNLAQLDGRTVKPEQLAAQIYALPFLAKTRLVILSDVFANKSLADQLIKILPTVPDTTVLVVYDRDLPDKRLKLFKELNKFAKVQEYKPLTGVQLKNWIKAYLGRWSVTIDQLAEAELIKRTGGKTVRLATELKKLATQILDSDQKVITFGQVQDQVISSDVISVFELTDALFKNPAQALKILRQLLDQGENPQYLVAMVNSSLRSLALIRAALDQGQAATAVAQATKLNPYVVKKQLSMASQLSLREISIIYNRLADLDIGVKHGTIEASLGLELFVASKLSFRAITD